MAAAIRTPDQRLRVFVSSTLGELAAEREAVRAAIERLRLTPVMFELGARPHPPRELYRSYLEQSDVFVGIYGEAYGWVAPEMEVSGLEDEYALSEGKPALLYVKEPAPHRDGRLIELVERIERDGRASYKSFATPEELAEQLENDLALLLAERFARPLELPSGTVTLLFTDIEGSTRLLKTLGERYRAVLEDHHRLLRQAFAAHAGHEIDTQGDAFFVSFRRAKDGVAAAAAAQRALAGHSWPEGAELRVRMGLHSGEPDAGGDNYVGLGVHRAARISAAGHGGQVLLSSTTRELVEDDLPPGITLRELGTYRLKDLDRPERLCQLEIDGLPGGFPPLEGERVATGFTRRRKLAAAGSLVLLALAIALPLLLLTGGSAAAIVAPNSVGVIDAKTSKVVTSIPVGTRPGDISYGSGSIWVANLDDNTVSRVDPRTQQALRAIPVGASPAGLAAGEGAVWVASNDGSVRRIDPQFDVAKTVRPAQSSVITTQISPSPVAVGAGSVWVSSYELLTRFDPVTAKAEKTVGLGFTPTGIAVGDGAVWDAESDDNQVRRTDLSGGTETIQVGQRPSGIAIGEGGVWVTDTLDDSVVRIDPGTRSVLTTIKVGSYPTGVAVGGGSVWVANSRSGTVSRIDPKTNRVVRTIRIGGSPAGVAVAGGRVYVSVQQSTSASLGAAVKGGQVRILLQSGDVLRNVDPALVNDSDAAQVLYATCAKLLNYPDRPGQAGLQLVPEVAKALPQVSDGGRTYTFTIRQGYRFSPPSNDPVTAQTFKDTIERVLNPATKSQVDFMDDVVGVKAFEAGRASHVSGIVAKGNMLTIRLVQASGSLPARLASPTFCAVPSGTPLNPEGVPAIPMAGPYYIAAYSPGRSLVLGRNPNYHGPRPHRPVAVEYDIGASIGHTVSAVETGGADYAPLDNYYPIPGGLLGRLASRYGASTGKEDGPRYLTNPNPTVGIVWMNTARGLFRDASLRRAVAYALDRRTLARIDAVGLAGEQVVDHMLPPGYPGGSGLRIYPATAAPAKARRLAQRHGGLAVLWQPAGVEEPLTAEVERDLARIGIQVVSRSFPPAVWLVKIRQPRASYDLLVGGAQPSYADPSDLVGQEFGRGFSNFDDPRYVRAFRAADRLTGRARYAAFAKLDLALARDAVPQTEFDYQLTPDFLSARMGCETYQPVYGMDLAALCLRQPR